MFERIKEYLEFRRWKREVERNRARYPDILYALSEGFVGEDDAVSEMLVRRRRELYEGGIRPDDPCVPDMFDFTVGSGSMYFFRVVKARRADRDAEFAQLRSAH